MEVVVNSRSVVVAVHFVRVATGSVHLHAPDIGNGFPPLSSRLVTGASG
jgi:hypothetical protein